MKIELIIFDCDGVLVDSEPISNSIFSDMLNEINIDIDPLETEKLFKGKSMQDCCNTVKERFYIKLDDKFIKKFRKRTFSAFEQNLQAIPGIKKVLKSLKYPKCVASSGPLKKIKFNLDITNLAKYFSDNLFSATELKKGKPSPDIFLYAAQKMNTDPNNCVVVEDSIPGVKAGLAAGMHVLLYGKEYKEQSFPCLEEVIVFDNMRDLPNIISKLSNN